MLRLLNFRCSFCSNPLDETQNTCGRRLQPIARYRPHPLQQRGHAARRGQAADRSAESSTRSPRLDFGAVTNLCDAVSVNIIFTISTNAFSPIAPTRIHRIRQRGCAAFGA